MSFHSSSRVRNPAIPMPRLRTRSRRRRVSAAAAEAAMRSNAVGSWRISVIASAVEEGADFAREPYVFRMAEGLGGHTRARQVHAELAQDAAGPRRHHRDAV